MELAAKQSAPAHLWVIGTISLLWNTFGCYDYLMSHVSPATYFKEMGLNDASVAYMQSFPAWLTAF